MEQKVSNGMRTFYETINSLFSVSVNIDWQQAANNRYIGTARVYGGEKWVDICSLYGGNKDIMEIQFLIYIVNQLNAIAMEKNDISFTSVYNENPSYIQRLVSEGVLVSSNKNAEYTASNPNYIGYPMINYLFTLLGYKIRTQLGCYYFGRIVL